MNQNKDKNMNNQPPKHLFIFMRDTKGRKRDDSSSKKKKRLQLYWNNPCLLKKNWNRPAVYHTP